MKYFLLKGHSDDAIVTAIDITSNGKFALTGSSSGTLSLVNLESSEIVQRFAKAEARAGIRFVCLLSDNTRFVFVDEANRIEMRRTFNDESNNNELVQTDVKVTCIAGLGLNYVMLGCENGEILLYDFVVNKYFKHPVHLEAVSKVKSHPSSEFLFFVSGSASGAVKFWYVAKTDPPFWSQIWSHNVHQHPITAIAFVPNCEDIVVGSYGSEVCCASSKFPKSC
jgi:WD40 repeat protein